MPFMLQILLAVLILGTNTVIFFLMMCVIILGNIVISTVLLLYYYLFFCAGLRTLIFHFLKYSFCKISNQRNVSTEHLGI